MEKEFVLKVINDILDKCINDEVPFSVNHWRDEISVFPDEGRDYSKCMNIILNEGPKEKTNPDSVKINIYNIGFSTIDLTDSECIEIRYKINKAIEVADVHLFESIRKIAKL